MLLRCPVVDCRSPAAQCGWGRSVLLGAAAWLTGWFKLYYTTVYCTVLYCTDIFTGTTLHNTKYFKTQKTETLRVQNMANGKWKQPGNWVRKLIWAANESGLPKINQSQLIQFFFWSWSQVQKCHLYWSNGQYRNPQASVGASQSQEVHHEELSTSLHRPLPTGHCDLGWRNP